MLTSRPQAKAQLTWPGPLPLVFFARQAHGCVPCMPWPWPPPARRGASRPPLPSPLATHARRTPPHLPPSSSSPYHSSPASSPSSWDNPPPPPPFLPLALAFVPGEIRELLRRPPRRRLLFAWPPCPWSAATVSIRRA